MVQNSMFSSSRYQAPTVKAEACLLQHNHDCTVWRESSQTAFNLYADGVKLWTKNDLLDIEHQLSESKQRKFFTVRLINGTILKTGNPMFDQESPIW